MEQPPEMIEPPPESAQPAPMSLGARLFNVIVSPGEVFDSVKTSPVSAWNWAMPALILILVSWICSAVIFSQDTIKQQINDITDQAIQKQVEAKKLSPEQAERAREMGAKYGAIGQKAGAAVLPVVVGFASPFLWGLLLWGAGTKGLKGQFRYMKAVEMVGLSNMIGVLHGIVKTLLMVIMGSLYAAPSLELLFGNHYNPQNPLHTLLALFDVMTFWVLAVRGVALAKLAKTSALKAGAWVFGIWAAYTGLFWGVGTAAQAVFKR